MLGEEQIGPSRPVRQPGADVGVWRARHFVVRLHLAHQRGERGMIGLLAGAYSNHARLAQLISDQKKRAQTTSRKMPKATSSRRFDRRCARRAPIGAVQIEVGMKSRKPMKET